jgi:phytoene dehydrogenase-like protein
VLIIGGGLAGLTCAATLERLSIPYTLVEASDTLGGRVQTDELDGFLLDRGFQVVLSSYEEVQMQCPWETLEAEAFMQGAVLVSQAKGLQPFLDPTRHPGAWASLLKPPLASRKNVVQLGLLKGWLGVLSEAATLNVPEETTLHALQRYGFTQETIDQFFKPFFGGVFLESALSTSVRKWRWTYHYFAKGQACLPKNGMGALSQSLAEQLPPERVRLNTRLTPFTTVGDFYSEAGERFTPTFTVLATELPAAAHLLQAEVPTESHAAETWYFSTETLPKQAKAALHLRHQGEPLNVLHWCYPSMVQANYAPPGQHLVSVSTQAVQQTRNEPEDAERLKQRLGKLLGEDVSHWRFLRRYWVANALPASTTLYGEPSPYWEKLSAKAKALNVLLAGDYSETASLQGALLSGRKAAMRVVKALKR